MEVWRKLPDRRESIQAYDKLDTNAAANNPHGHSGRRQSSGLAHRLSLSPTGTAMGDGQEVKYAGGELKEKFKEQNK
jgi:hypothetical protein